MTERLNLDEVTIDPHWALAIPPALSQRRKILAFAEVDKVVHIACANPSDQATIQAVKRHIKQEYVLEAASFESLDRALKSIFGDRRSGRASGYYARADLPKSAGAGRGSKQSGIFRSLEGRRSTSSFQILAPDSAAVADDDAVQLCDQILQSAILRKASDIHIDPHETRVRVRLRVDGQLEELTFLTHDQFNPVLSRFKVLAGMDISEKRTPQDGGFRHDIDQNRRVELRVASLPTKFGERLTLRLLALQTDKLTLNKLGLIDGELERFDRAIQAPFGLILVTGPTGSGKSTTLYAAIRRLIQSQQVNIITIEDPIEYSIEGVSQCEVDSADKVSFQKALRSTLRHDPDIIMIGEIRDYETADVALKSALTGHMVFSTLHTNSAPSAVTRLADMGVDRYLIAATLRLAMAQRLVRKLCQQCLVPRPATTQEAIILGKERLQDQSVYSAAGCKYCAGKGTQGRVGVFELMSIDSTAAELVHAGASEQELTRLMREKSEQRLLDDAVAKVINGQVSVNDVLKIVAA